MVWLGDKTGSTTRTISLKRIDTDYFEEG